MVAEQSRLVSQMLTEKLWVSGPLATRALTLIGSRCVISSRAKGEAIYNAQITSITKLLDGELQSPVIYLCTHVFHNDISAVLTWAMSMLNKPNTKLEISHVCVVTEDMWGNKQEDTTTGQYQGAKDERHHGTGWHGYIEIGHVDA